METDLIRNTLEQLRRLERHASTPEQQDALRLSRLLLYFIQGRDNPGAFADYLEVFNTPKRTPALSFATKEEAESWLQKHPAPPHGATIGAADTRYILAYSRDLNHRKLLRMHSEEELAGLEEEEEATNGMDEETNPPELPQGKRWSLFELLEWTAFYLYELEKRIASPEAHEALRVSKIAFHFVMDSGEEHGFEEYQQTLHASEEEQPVHAFATQQEANNWLARQPEPPTPVVVSVGNERLSVGYDRLRRRRVLIRLPTRQELDGKDGSALTPG